MIILIGNYVMQACIKNCQIVLARHILVAIHADSDVQPMFAVKVTDILLDGHPKDDPRRSGWLACDSSIYDHCIDHLNYCNLYVCACNLIACNIISVILGVVLEGNLFIHVFTSVMFTMCILGLLELPSACQWTTPSINR